MTDHDFWLMVRRALLMLVAAIEKRWLGEGKVTPRPLPEAIAEARARSAAAGTSWPCPECGEQMGDMDDCIPGHFPNQIQVLCKKCGCAVGRWL